MKDAVSMTVWDSDAKPSEHDGLVYTWNGYAQKDLIRSLLCYVEIHGDRLRHQYLAWIHDFGERRIDGKRIVDHLALENGLSFWWMTLFFERSPWNCRPLNDTIRLLALDQIIAEQKPGKLRLVSANRSLHEVLRDLCLNLSIAYVWERLPNSSPRELSLRNIFHALPHPLPALGSLARYLWMRWPFRGAEKPDWFRGDQARCFFSYFDNVDPQAAERGSFHSHYWTGLRDVLNRNKHRSNWLQLFIPCREVPTPRAAMAWARRFNRERQSEGVHVFLDSYLSWRIILRVLKRWLRLNLAQWRMRAIGHAFRPQDSQISLWPILREGWLASVRGPDAIRSLLCIELFDRALRDLPRQQKGLYLCENQSWERALIHAWRKNGHGQLIAVVHGAVRFWDLRYFTDSRTIRSSDSYPLPLADRLALNGKSAVDAYLSVDYPKAVIVECEALRYGYLNELRTRSPSRKTRGDAIKVLILGDYLSSATIKLLQLLEAAAPLLSDSATYTVKPHPNCLVKAEDYPSLHLKVVMNPLGEILSDYDIASSSNMTSAGEGAYLAGLPVVAMLDDTELNVSPLRGHPGVRFVGTPEKLAEALQTARHHMVDRPDSANFYFLDPHLPRWSRLLANGTV